MAKTKSSYFCQKCGYESPKWLGKCPTCASWNTFVEEVLQKETSEKHTWKTNDTAKHKRTNTPTPIHQINQQDNPRIVAEDQELNRVLGGGIVPGSLVLIGGEPGIGKSTLMLQLALKLQQKILYVSGEESEVQIKLRANRMTFSNENCFVFSETNTQKIFRQIEELEPDIIVIDSVQTVHSDIVESMPGSVSQVRECTGEFLKFAKETNTPVFLIGHITKDGQIAGPKLLEHMVDAVLQFEGDRHMSYRILRTVKNRFGSTSELGIYEMLGDGLREVSNPSELLISKKEGRFSGVSIAASQEGAIYLLIEVQALVATAAYGTPQRTSTGFDVKRLNMLLAVLEKRTGFRLSSQDVFLNIAGGLKVDDPAIDLAICMAIVSSYEEYELSEENCFAGEIGLGGEIRPVNHVEQRIGEAEKLGFKRIVLSKFNKIDTSKFNIQIVQSSKLSDAIREVFG